MLKNLFGSFLFCALFAACNNDECVLLAEIPFRVEFEIPAGLNTLEDHFFELKNINNITESVLTGRGTTLDAVSRIEPQIANISVLFDDTSLGFIRECSISLFSDQVGRRSEAFWTPSINFNQGNSLDVPGTLIDAKDFLEQERINIEVRLDTREVNTQFITVRLDITFRACGE